MGFISPASGVTIPCRSESASLPVEMSYLSLFSIREAIAYGLEQSIRILPSQSSVMNGHAGSTVGSITSRPMSKLSAMYSQYCTEAPPIGCAPIFRPAARMASRSMAFLRSSQ